VQSACVKAGADAYLAKGDLRGLGKRVLGALFKHAGFTPSRPAAG